MKSIGSQPKRLAPCFFTLGGEGGLDFYVFDKINPKYPCNFCKVI